MIRCALRSISGPISVSVRSGEQLLMLGNVHLQCTVDGARHGLTGEKVMRRVDWMLQHGVFPRWQWPSATSYPEEAMTTLSTPVSAPVATNGDTAQSPVKPQKDLVPSLGEV